jgi:hypothetical protein
MDKLALYPKELENFLERGGMISWGIIPNQDYLILSETVGTLVKRLEDGLELLASKGVDKELLARQSFVTTSCVTIGMSIPLAEKAFQLTRQVGEIMLNRYFADRN